MFSEACRPSCGARPRSLRATVLAMAEVVPFRLIFKSAYNESCATHSRRTSEGGSPNSGIAHRTDGARGLLDPSLLASTQQCNCPELGHTSALVSAHEMPKGGRTTMMDFESAHWLQPNKFRTDFRKLCGRFLGEKRCRALVGGARQ